MKMKPPSGPKKTNPKQSQFFTPLFRVPYTLRGPALNLKSLAGKSGHTRRSPMGAIILTFVSDIHILKWFLQGEVK